MVKICPCDCGCENTAEWHNEPRCACRDLNCICVGGNYGECEICGEKPPFPHCGECHMAAEEGREAHSDWNNKD